MSFIATRFLLGVAVFHSIPIALTGEPEAPINFNGVIMSVNLLVLNFSKLQRFSIIMISLANKILCTLKLLSIPGSILGQSIATALTFFSIRYFAASVDRPGLSDI